MNLAAISVIVGIAGVVGGLWFSAWTSIKEGRRQREAHEKTIYDDGYKAGVASLQAELLNLRSDFRDMKDSRDYYRGTQGGGTDHRNKGNA